MIDRKGSEFLCKVRFKNTLPELPFDPKFLVNPIDPARFVKYRTTSLIKKFKFDLHSSPVEAVPIDLIDAQRYEPQKGYLLIDHSASS